MELLSLLEARAALEAERPEDTRQPISELVEQARQQAAASSGDPAAWLAADAAHAESRSAHYQRLMCDRGESMQDINAWMEASLAVWAEATELAAADGHPPADEALKRPAPEVEADMRPSLPRATAEDVTFTKARERTAAVSEAEQPSAPSPAPAHDRLEGFRGPASRSEPTVWSDGV